MAEKFSRDLLPLLKPIDFATEDPENAKVHPADSITALKESLEKYGQVRAIVYWHNEKGQPIIKAGNGTYRAARELGWGQLAMTEFEGTAEEAMSYALADNHTSELSQWDTVKRDFQIKALGLTWEMPKIDWKPVDVEWAPAPAVTVVPPREAPKHQEPSERRRTSGEVEWTSPTPEGPSGPCRVQPGDLWILGNNKVLCGRTYDAKAIRLLCGLEHPALRYAVLPPDTKPRWWSSRYAAGARPTWNGWSVLIRALNGEIHRAGWTPERVVEITRNEKATAWFENGPNWELLPRDAYEALSAAGKESSVFAHPYDALVAVVEKLRRTLEMDVEYAKEVLDELCVPYGSVLVLDGPVAAVSVAAQQTGRHCLGVVEDPWTCAEALTFCEEKSGIIAEKA